MRTNCILLPLAVLMTALSSCDAAAGIATPLAPADSGTGAAAQDTAELSLPADTATATTRPTLLPTETSTSTRIILPTVSRSADCLKAQFLGDITIPDGWEIAPNTPFTKTWRLKNTGSCSWTPEFSLVFHSGDRMEAPESQPLTAQPVTPGGSVDISVDLVSPDEAGFHQASFMIRTPDGAVFGIGKNSDVAFWVKITVKTQKAPTAAAPVTKSVSAKVTVAAGHWISVSADCPAGWVVTGGGFSTDNTDVNVYSQFPDGNGWTAFGKNYDAVDHTLTVSAICLASPVAVASPVLITVPLAAGGTRTDTVFCPAGTVPTGGGFSATADPRLEIITSFRNGDGWKVTARNVGTTPAEYAINGLCLAAAGPKNRDFRFYMWLEPDESAYGTSSCPDGWVLAGGGWLGEEGLAVSSAEWFGGWWRVHARNDKSSSGRKQLEAAAICLSSG